MSFLAAAFDNVLILCVLILLWLFAVAALVGLFTDRLMRRVDAAAVSFQLARGRVIADGPLTSRAAAALGTVLAGSIALMSLLTLVVEPEESADAPTTVTSGFVRLPVSQWRWLVAPSPESRAFTRWLSRPSSRTSATPTRSRR